MTQAIKNVRTLISHFTLNKENELWKIVTKMGLADLNRALYRCDQEERDEGHGFDTYEIPNFGRLVYAGFQGFMSLLSTIRPSNDLGHPMCANLRDGNWMIGTNSTFVTLCTTNRYRLHLATFKTRRRHQIPRPVVRRKHKIPESHPEIPSSVLLRRDRDRCIHFIVRTKL